MKQPDIKKTTSSANIIFTNSRWAAYSIILLFSGLVWIFVSRIDQTSTGAEDESAPYIGFNAPDFSLLNDRGETVSSLDYLGNPFIINLWASWCPPCRAEMPALERVYQEYNSAGLEILAINATNQDDRQKAIQFTREIGISFPTLFDVNGLISELYHLQALPTTFFIDENGVIQDIVIGGPMSETLLRTRVEEMFNTQGGW